MPAPLCETCGQNEQATGLDTCLACVVCSMCELPADRTACGDCPDCAPDETTCPTCELCCCDCHIVCGDCGRPAAVSVSDAIHKCERCAA